MDMKELLQYSVNQNASDLHILPELPPMVRIHGDLIPVKNVAILTAEKTKELLYSVMTITQQENFEKTLEFDMALSVPDVGNFRVSAMHQLHGVAGIFRVIPERVPTFEELNLPPILKTLSMLPHGLILVTGPTGSGKSTTMASMIDFINMSRSCNIITIEDPIEYIYQNKKSLINQRQIHRDTLDGATALRSALRQDPDVILLGEMRDLDTIRLALTAAETGHLVMTTLHASSAPLAISRIIDAFPNDERNRVRNLLAECVQAVICQTLVKKVSGGRIGAFEIMLATPAIKHLIREDKIPHMVMTIQTNGDIGMITLDQYLESLVMKNIITLATARSAAVNKDWF
ncbi:MAG: hypothetical protein ACD_46C00437G0003 [uncultured bacterium]|nr:MAG: hypothetical protein ACD_46C00437G0003 [uncultured bacterium]